jgi:hypothetical protein
MTTFEQNEFKGRFSLLIDERSVTLGYRYCIKSKLLKIFEETTIDLPHTGVNICNIENYPTHYYTVWCDYSKKLYESVDY